jgi:hypothetical protein
VVIRRYHSDHSPPHFYAHYGDAEATIDIRHLAVTTGKLPPRALGMVIEWAAMHQRELLERWQQAERNESLARIEPLQ